PGAPRWLGSRDQASVWEAASPKMLMSGEGGREEKFDHPTQKPAALYSRPLENHLRRGACFYEPFAGSGTALIAAEMRGRVCLAMELDPGYCDVIRDRFENYVNGGGGAGPGGVGGVGRGGRGERAGGRFRVHGGGGRGGRRCGARC